MENISLKGENVKLNSGENYIIIDALYLDQIKNTIKDKLHEELLINEIKKLAFPFLDTPYAIINPVKGVFKVDFIKKVDYATIEEDYASCFSTDTGLILIFKEIIFRKIAEKYNYDKLTDSISENINTPYWKELISGLNFLDIALIMSPGIYSKYDFSGSGTYKVICQ